eukprot:4135850-Pyramimonas_sp.AAC.1
MALPRAWMKTQNVMKTCKAIKGFTSVERDGVAFLTGILVACSLVLNCILRSRMAMARHGGGTGA